MSDNCIKVPHRDTQDFYRSYEKWPTLMEAIPNVLRKKLLEM